MQPTPTALRSLELKAYIKRFLLLLAGHLGQLSVLGGAAVIRAMVSGVVKGYFQEFEFLGIATFGILIYDAMIFGFEFGSSCTVVEMSKKLWCGADGCNFPIYLTTPVSTLPLSHQPHDVRPGSVRHNDVGSLRGIRRN